MFKGIVRIQIERARFNLCAEELDVGFVLIYIYLSKSTFLVNTNPPPLWTAYVYSLSVEISSYEMGQLFKPLISHRYSSMAFM